MNLTGLDNENVTGLSVELLALHDVARASFANEQHFVIWMAMRPGAAARRPVEEHHRQLHGAMMRAFELVRVSLEWQVVSANSVHVTNPNSDCQWRRC